MIKLNEVSQSKKIGQFIDASVFIKWYKENKTKISSILKVDENALPSVEEMLSQSYGLLKNVINPQSFGNRGDRTAFEAFVNFDKILIHDFLHNLYDVAEKDFIKSLTDYEFTIDELIEEIEILAIEESFMKFMNIRYPKRDFINQNINQLASYAVPTFIKDNTEDFFKIVSGEEEPFLIIQGKKLYLEGTPYEGIGEILKNLPLHPHLMSDNYNEQYIETPDDFKNFIADLLAISETIDETGGDRSQFPDNGDYYGQPDDDDYYSDRYIEYFYEEAGSGDWGVAKWDDYLELIKEKIKEENEELSDDEIDEYFTGDKTDENFPGLDFAYDDAYNTDTYTRKVKDKDNNQTREDYYFYQDDSLVPIEANVRELLKFDDYGFYEYVREENNERNNQIYIDFYDEFFKLSLPELTDKLFNNSTARAIFRRLFRGTDLLRNVSKPTTGKWQNINYNFSLNNFFETPYPSLSKKLYTENAKKLYVLLNEFRGYVIRNIGNIKSTYKQNIKLDQNFFSFFKNLFETNRYYSNERYLVALTNPENIEFFFNNFRTVNFQINFWLRSYSKEKFNTIINLPQSMDLILDLYELTPKLIGFINQYKDIISKVDDNYLIQFPLFKDNPKIKDMFSDETYLNKLKILNILLGKWVKVFSNITNRGTSITDSLLNQKLNEIDLMLIKKTLNLKYKGNVPNEAYTKLITNAINEILSKNIAKPKSIKLLTTGNDLRYDEIGSDESGRLAEFQIII
jgi:predicted house-cleaning noncanonical NTP pyrophosphatase (MazG superfamily)